MFHRQPRHLSRLLRRVKLVVIRGMTKPTRLSRLQYLAVFSAGILVFSTMSGGTYLLIVSWPHLLDIGSTRVILEDILCMTLWTASFFGISYLALVASDRLGAWYHNEDENRALQIEKFGAVSAGLGLNVMNITGTWLLDTRLGNAQIIGMAIFAVAFLLTIHLTYLAVCVKQPANQ